MSSRVFPFFFSLLVLGLVTWSAAGVYGADSSVRLSQDNEAELRVLIQRFYRNYELNDIEDQLSLWSSVAKDLFSQRRQMDAIFARLKDPKVEKLQIHK